MKNQPKPIEKKLSIKELLDKRKQKELEIFEKRIHIRLSNFSDKPELDNFNSGNC